MANEKTIKDPNEERVKIFVEKTYESDDPNEYICINGKEFLLPRGQYSEVPLYVKKALDRKRRAVSIQDKRNTNLREKANKPI